MLPGDKVKAIKKIMKEFDTQYEILKSEYRTKIRKVLDKLEKEKIEKLRAELNK